MQEEDVIFHDGPGQAYLSRAPNDDLANYDGKGDWFKVAYAGPSDDKTWSLKWKNGVGCSLKVCRSLRCDKTNRS